MKMEGSQTEIFFFCLTVIILFLLLLSPSIAFIDGDRNQHQQIAMALQEGREEQEEDDNQALETFQREFCGVDAKPNSNEYITEYVLPQTCEMPLGIAADEDDNDVDDNDNDNDQTNKVWYVSTKKGLLGSYNIEEDKFDKEHLIPNWKVRENPRGFSQVWEIEVDSRRGEEEGVGGDVWFTDEQQNAIWRYIKSSKTFEMYIIPGKSEDFGTTYPLSIEFDPNNENIIYFVGTYSPSLWIADISEMKNGTSDGISQIPIPIEEGFRGIDSVYITTGSIAFDNKRDAIWISVLSYAAQKGQIFKYDLDKKSFDVYDLPEEEQGLSSPWGLVVDDIHNDGDLWITNPGTSLFYKIDPDDDNNIVKFVTSKTSPRIFGDINTINNNNNISNIYKNSYTQPSWIKKSNDGSIWFNEQQGNKIARFDPSDMKLIEYWVPTQNRLWGVCSNDDNNSGSSSNNNIVSINSNKETCGIANVLQFSIGQDRDDGEDYQIWFTEWSENKIGKLEVDDDDDGNLPFSITVFESDKELTIERGEREEIEVRVKAAESPSSSLDNIRMIASGTFTSTGDLGNSIGYFTEQSISMDAGEEREVSFAFIPSTDLKPGDYVLMIGGENDSISYLKAIRIRIT